VRTDRERRHAVQERRDVRIEPRHDGVDPVEARGERVQDLGFAKPAVRQILGDLLVRALDRRTVPRKDPVEGQRRQAPSGGAITVVPVDRIVSPVKSQRRSGS